MRFWTFGSFPSFLIIGAFLGMGMALMRVPFLKTSRIPYSIVSGIFLLLIGPQLLDLLFVDTLALEAVVYHGLALTFIAIGLQAPPSGSNSLNTVAMGLAMPLMAVAQGAVGLSIILILPLLTSESLHPGLGLLLPLGFNQGPGQALSLGEAWVAKGLTDGGQIGLILAAVGFGWSILIGVPFVLWLKKHRHVTDRPTETHTEGTDHESSAGQLSQTVALVSGVYLICYGLLSVLDGLLEEKPGIQSMIWGFHYLIALIIAVGVRQIQMRFFKVQNDTQSLTQVANLSVDWVTCAAIAAIQIHVLSQNWLPILLLSAVGLVVTLLLVLWWSSRGFTQDKAEHAIVWFGASTGTLPMGLALLRMVDPSLKSTAPSSVALGSMVSLVASIPLLLVIMPYVIDNYPEGHPTASIQTIGVLALYFLTVSLIWWRTVRFSLTTPHKLWRT